MDPIEAQLLIKELEVTNQGFPPSSNELHSQLKQ